MTGLPNIPRVAAVMAPTVTAFLQKPAVKLKCVCSRQATGRLAQRTTSQGCPDKRKFDVGRLKGRLQIVLLCQQSIHTHLIITLRL